MLTKESMDIKRIAAITEAPGHSGLEAPVTRLMKQALEGYADSFDYDNLGSLICYKKGSGKGPKVMLSSHADEIGFLVKSIDERGIIRVMSLQTWWTYTLIAQEIEILTQEGKLIPGIFGTHFPDENLAEPKYRSMDDLYVDIGVRGKQNVEKLGIQRGDTITVKTAFREMADPDVMMAKAWDDRIGVNIITDVMQQLKGQNHQADLYVCGTVQEELGWRGGKTCSYKVHPDLAITVDVARCDDFPHCDPEGFRLKGGVVIRHYDSKVAGNQAFSRFIRSVAEELGYPVEIIVQNYGGGEAHEIHRQFDGIVTICLSVPVLYLMTPRGLVHKDRYVATVNTLVEVIKRLSNVDLQAFIESKR
ncbi:MAG: hypothetical protein VB108_01965 [Anaerolineaceae bacterium]|nr:hypothetical protein [Anaerolineaceae bacterium]